MGSLLIHVLEIALAGGFLYLAWLVMSLSRQEAGLETNATSPARSLKSHFSPHSATSVSASARHKTGEESAQFSRIDSISKAQIFAGLQLLELKRDGIDLSHTKSWLYKRSALYLLGATNAICEHFGCEASERADVVAFVLTRNMGMNKSDADALLFRARKNFTKEDAEAVAAGKKAAESWINLRFTPKSESLKEQILCWGLTL